MYCIKEAYKLRVTLYAEEGMSPCPCCGSRVSIMTGRDLNVEQYYVDCLNEDCEVSVFHTEVHTRQSLPQSSIDNMKLLYNEWCESLPERWCEDTWEHYTRHSGWYLEASDYGKLDV